MILAPAEQSLFFKLMLPLQFFVNEKLGVLPEVLTFEDYCRAPMLEKFKVRNALFENIGLIDEFIDENPPDIPMRELAAVSRWKKFVRGDFFIERYLKNHAVFITDDAEVYAVHGLTESPADYFPKFTLPVRLNAVLLPFQDKIVIDGFFLPYRVVFGSGIKNELKEIYNSAKQKGKIITSL